MRDHCSINFLLLRCILLGHGIASKLQGTTAQRLAAQHQQHLQWGVQKPCEPIKRPSAVTTCVDSFPTGPFTNFSISNPNCLNYYPAFRNLLLAWLSESFQARTCNVVVFSQAVQCMLGVLQFRVSSLIIYLKFLKYWSCGNSPQSHRVLICCIAILGCIVGLSHKEWRRICYQSLCRIGICIVGASMQFERCHRICFKFAKYFSISLSLSFPILQSFSWRCTGSYCQSENRVRILSDGWVAWNYCFVLVLP